MRLFAQYRGKCQKKRINNVFYLQPLQKPTDDCRFSVRALGHYSLGSTVARLCKKAGIPGFKTNHSLRATAATRLYQAGLDEQLVMERTGHRSSEGVRSYKRTSEQQAEDDVSDVLHRSMKVCTTVDRSESEANTVPTGFPGTFNFTSCNSVTINLQFNTGVIYTHKDRATSYYNIVLFLYYKIMYHNLLICDLYLS